MSEPLDPDEARATLADNGIDGPDQPYNPRALAAMRTADRLLAEVERLTAELAKVDRLAQSGIHAEAEAVRQVEAERDALRAESERLAEELVTARSKLADARTAHRDLAEGTEWEHRRLEAERADAIRDFVLANDRAGELETELELMRHSRDRYRAVVERVRQVTGKWHQTTNDDPWATIGLVSAAGEILNALSATETSGVDSGTSEARSAVHGAHGGADGTVSAEPRTIDLSRVRGYMWTDPDGTQRMIPPDEIGVLVADSVPAPAKPRVIAWDWKQQIPLDELCAALDAGLVHLHEVDTGSDECAIVLASAPMEPAAVHAAYEHRDEDYDATKRTWTKPEKCGRCLRPFDPTDTAWNGGARHQDGPWCRSCVDRCHESTDFAHECAVCREATDV